MEVGWDRMEGNVCVCERESVCERETRSSELRYSVVCMYVCKVCMYVHVQVYVLWDFFKISIEDQLGTLRAPKLPTYDLCAICAGSPQLRLV